MRLQTTTDPLLHTSTFDYTPTSGISAYTHTTKSVYKAWTPPADGAPGGIETDQTFDNNFRVLTKTIAGSTTAYGYDPNGNCTSVTDPLAACRHRYGFSDMNAHVITALVG